MGVIAMKNVVSAKDENAVVLVFLNLFKCLLSYTALFLNLC